MKRTTHNPLPVLSILAVIAVLGAAWVVTNFRGFGDTFRGDTLQARMELNIVAVTGDEKGVSARIEPGSYGGEVVGFRILTKQLPAGAEALLSVSLPLSGFYSEGGGWIFPGRKYYGTHAVNADVISAASSRPEVLDAVVDRFGQIRLAALAPGTSTLELTARRKTLDPRDPKPPAVTDSIELTVVSTSAFQ